MSVQIALVPISILASEALCYVGGEKLHLGHSDGDPDKTKEEYDDDNRSDQLNPNNDEYQGDE